jgi:tetratricopeptide (TPR) repeat protein
MESVMKGKTIILSIALFVISICAFSQDPGQRMKEAEDLYQKGDYFNAAELYKSLYKEGYRSDNLLFNTGNACFKAADYGNAILYYERAALLDPASEDINYNLQIARTKITDRFDEIPELFFIRWFDFLSLLKSTNQWATIAIVLFILAMAFIILFLFAPAGRYKYPSFWSGVAAVILSGITLIFAIRSNSLVNHNKEGIVICSEVVGKSSPGDTGKDLFVIHAGAKVVILQRLGDFSEIVLPDGNKGWTSAKCIEKI